jgi:hypothetical protein
MSGIQPQRQACILKSLPFHILRTCDDLVQGSRQAACGPRSAGVQFFTHGRKEEEYG